MSRSMKHTGRSASQQWSRDWIIVVLFTAFLAAIIGNLVYIQIIRGPEFASMAAEAHMNEITLSARRGTVYDRNGEVIASNVDATTIYVNPQEVTEPDKLAGILFEVLGEETGRSKEDFLSTVSQSDLSFAYILRKADLKTADALKGRLKNENVAGIHYLEDTKRIYPNGTVGQQVVGLVDIDGKGISGLELQYDKILKGQDGTVVVERGLNDIPMSNGEASRVNTVNGTDIVTSVDINLQKLCEERLLRAIVDTESQSGTVTVMDASNGEIYAACSYAKKSNEELEADAKQLEKLEAKAAAGEDVDMSPYQIDYKLEVGKLGSITDIYEPGSTFKAFTAYSVLANNENITPQTTYNVPYALDVYDTTITDSHDHALMDMTITAILADSSNTGTTLMSREVSTSTLYDTYSAFGFGQRTGCDFPGDAAGQLEQAKDWDGVQSATVTFGQGLTVSPLQLVRGYGVLQQGGIMTTPHFLTGIPNDEEKEAELLANLTTRTTVADAETCKEVGDMLTEVVTNGTGQAAAVESFTVSGKTGTAEIASVNGGYEENAYIMSFCGWLHNSSSNLICLVTLNRPHSDKGAGAECGPVFADIMSYAAKRYQVDAQSR